MVLDYYNLREQPFGSTPDTRFLFLSETHREALASLLYGIKTGRGFIALIARPGMGKTTLLFRSLNKLKDSAKTVFLFQTISTPFELLRTLLKDLGVEELSGGLDELQARLTQILTEQSRRGEQLIVVIDEAQNLSNEVLELVRMLSNFETSKEKLMQIILSGQPQLARKLASDDLLQLRQRISIIAQLQEFSADETMLYIDHRLQIAGYSGRRSLFTSAAMQLIAEYSRGIPRNINTLCFNALSIGAALKKPTIDADVVREVIADLDLEPLKDTFTARPPGFKSVLERPAKSSFRVWVTRVAAVSVMLLAIVAASRTLVHKQAAEPKSGKWTVPAEHMETTPDILPEEDAQIDAPPLPFEIPTPMRDIPWSQRQSARLEEQRHEKYLRGSSVFSNEVLVRPGMNFYSICAEVFSDCNLHRVEELRRLNPWLSDSNHVKVGDVLVIPPRADLSEAASANAFTPR
ncbi:MAG TPA: AAA family ATPase [Terracidiphilus sp.]|nr:AAA family ATPase [Terracidiphilus sp.]